MREGERMKTTECERGRMDEDYREGEWMKTTECERGRMDEDYRV